MKTKLSLTLEESLVRFVDGQSGGSRSEKLEAIVRRYREVHRDLELRRQLAATTEFDDASESDAWRRTMEEAQWTESGEAISGQSPSPTSRGRGRR